MTITKRFLILTVSAIFALISCNQSNNKTDNISFNENKTESQKKEGLFDNPRKLCATLSQNGIGELKEWKNPMEMGWGSLTDYYQFGPQKSGSGIQNNIAYNLEGTETSVGSLTINLNINNADDKKNALKFLADVTEKTFSSLKLTIPSDLTKAILSSKDFKIEVNEFLVSNELEKSKIETWKVTIKKK